MTTNTHPTRDDALSQLNFIYANLSLDSVSDQTAAAYETLRAFIEGVPDDMEDSALEPAKAICKTDGNDWEELGKTYNGSMQQRRYMAMAEAALVAKGMRPIEPTPELKALLHEADNFTERENSSQYGKKTTEIYRAVNNSLPAIEGLDEAIYYAENEPTIDGNISLAFDWVDVLVTAARAYQQMQKQAGGEL